MGEVRLKNDFCAGLIRFLVYFILGYAVVSCILCMCGLDVYGIAFHHGWLAGASAVVILLILVCFRIENLPRWVILTAGFAIANAIMLWVIFTAHTKPVSDWANVFNMAIVMADGNYDATEQDIYSYGNIFNWQTGIAWLESMFFRIYRPSVALLKVASLVMINLTLLLVYFTGRIFNGEKAGRFAFILICLFYPMLVAVGQFSNQIFVAPFILLLVLAVRKEKYLLCGVLIPLISFIRPVGLILAIAVGCWLVYSLLVKQRVWQRFLVKTALFVVPLAAVTWGIDAACIAAGYSRGPVSQPTLPYFKFYQGLFIEKWNNPADKIREFDGDVERYNDWNKEELKKAYTADLGKTLGNNFLKMTMLLGMYDWKVAYTYNQWIPEPEGRSFSKYIAIGWGEYLVLLLLCILGYGLYVRRHGLDFLQILIVGLISVYFFIEAWPDYRYEIYPLLFILASLSYQRLADFQKRQRPRKELAK